MEFQDYYKTLGVSRTADASEIKRAYRRLARKYHPDVSKEPDAESKFKSMKEAYEVLKDPEKRAAYDQFGENWKSGQQFEPPPEWERKYAFDGGAFETGAEFSDFFESLFGGARRARGGSFSQGFENSGINGNDINASITISLEDAFHGVSKRISLDIPEPDSSGRVSRKRRTLNVRIPKGVKAGQRIRLGSQGQQGLGKGSRAGDLYMTVEFEPHPVYEVRGKDLYVDLPVAPWEAALGRTVKVPTLAGPVDLKIPAGTSSGKRLRLKGRGLPGNPPGDQYVKVSVAVPDSATEKERDLYEQLEKLRSFNPRVHLGV